MSCGLVPLVSDIRANQETIGSDFPDYVRFSTESEDSLVRILEKSLELSGNEMEKLSKASRIQIEKKYSRTYHPFD